MSRFRAVLLALGAALLLSCSDVDKPAGPSPDKPGPPAPPAALTIAVHTTGRDPDPDGYRLSIDGSGAATVPANGTLRLSEVLPGTYQVEIDDVARWCEVVQGPEDPIEVGSTGDYHLEIRVDCRTTFRDWLLYDGNAEIRLFDLTADPAQRTRLGYSTIACGGFCSGAAVSPDGTQVAWGGVGGIVVMNADGSGRRSLVGPGPTSASPSWSPDGMQVAYVDTDGTTADIYVVYVDGRSAPQRLTVGGAYDPAWSPDGSTIAFSRLYGPEPTRELWLIDPTGSNLRPLGATGVIQLGASWSPDGQSILYDSDFRMRLISIDGSNDRRVGPDQGYHADWSRDGQRIVFTAYDESGCRTWLATMASDGTDVAALGPFGDACNLEGPPMPQTNHPEWGY